MGRAPGDIPPSRTAAELFRQDIREWIRTHAPAGLTGPPPRPAEAAVAEAAMEEAAAEAAAVWERSLLDARLICADWQPEYGGSGLSPQESLVFEEECARAGAPRIRRGAGERIVGPTILAHGTEEQKSRLLPGIVSGEHTYCLAYSEPEHGSDLASVGTRGTVTGDEIVITGRKAWVDGAERADRALVLCRTGGPDASGHRGLSCVVVPLDSGNGVVRRVVRQADGTADCRELSFDRSRAPLRDVVGEVNGGWRAVMTGLAHERAGRAAGRHLGFEAEFWDLVREADKTGRSRDPVIRDRLAWAYTRITLLRLLERRAAARTGAGAVPGADAAVTHLLSAEYHRRFGEIALDIMGAPALVRPDGDGYATDRWQEALLTGRAGTIRSGTAEILRDVIAERLLGLPKEPRAARRRPS
ncbi:acyl-CoA dehydrogenase family protein [Streptomyces sp. MnatMP-M17]|uniref:acyl-CoA dehydrogenase family protein n=1 Tax=unclassified Streptomyces TaxID=2593676 RepID=UPI00081F270A|nr:acyl-CoA dehydrogenase family protein [Streptomyces sp. MnatMP-M17]SCG05475.1 Acyl-CoA dehydrogenase [Streptomyces sp. MnatMP-M17]